MNVKLTINFQSGPLVYSNYSTTGAIGNLISISPITQRISEDYSWNGSDFTVTLSDPTEPNSHAAYLKRRQWTHIGVILEAAHPVAASAPGVPEKYTIVGRITGPPIRKGGSVTFTVSQSDGVIDQKFPETVITDRKYPYCPEANRGLPIPLRFGTLHSYQYEDKDNLHAAYGGGSFTCPRVGGEPDDGPEGPQGRFLIAGHWMPLFDFDPPVAGKKKVPAVWLEGQVPITQTPTFGWAVNHPDGYSYYYIDTSQLELEEGDPLPEYLLMNSPGYGLDFYVDWLFDPIDCLEQFCVMHDIAYNLASFDVMRAFTRSKGYIPAWNIEEESEFYDHLSALALNFGFYWTRNDAGEIELHLEPSETTSKYTYSPANTISYTVTGHSDAYNIASCEFHYVPAHTYYYSKLTRENRHSRSVCGDKDANISLMLVAGDTIPDYRLRVIERIGRWLADRDTRREKGRLSMALWDAMGAGVGLGDTITLSHPDAENSGESDYHVVGWTRDVISDTASLELRSLTGLPEAVVEITPLHLDADGATLFDINTTDSDITGTLYGTLTTDPGAYGDWWTISSDGYIGLSSPIAGFPWADTVGATIMLWIDEGGEFAMGADGSSWGDTTRRVWVRHKTSWNPGILSIRVGPGNLPSETVYTEPKGKIHLTIVITPEESGYSTIITYVNGENRVASGYTVNCNSGLEISFIGALGTWSKGHFVKCQLIQISQGAVPEAKIKEVGKG